MSQVWRILKGLDIDLSKVRGWLNRRDDPDFWDQVRDICGLYLNGPDNAIVLSVYEKTSIQAKEPKHRDGAVAPNRWRRREFEHVRHGTTGGYGDQTKLTAYCMSKGALTILTRNLAFGLMKHGIRVNHVNPGWMETEPEHRTQLEHENAPDNWLELAAPGRPLGRLVQPWEVANAICHYLSPDTGMMTGNIIDIDQSVQGAGDPPLPSDTDTVSP